MSEEDIKRDINGLGIRLNELALKEADCSGRTSERLRQIEAENTSRGEEITRIFQTQEVININLAEVKTTIKTWGVIIGFASPLVAAIISAIIARVM